MIALKPTTLPQTSSVRLYTLRLTIQSIRPSKEALIRFVFTLLLCPSTFGFGTVPAAICPLCTCAIAHLPAVAFGIALGYGLFWGFRPALSMYAIAAVVLCARLLLRNRPKGRLLLTIPTLAVGIIEFLFLFSSGFRISALLPYGIKLFVCAGGTMLFQAHRNGSDAARIAIASLLLLGLHCASVPIGIDLTPVALGWLVCAPGGSLYVFAGCAMLALCDSQTALYAAVFSVLTLCLKRLQAKPKSLRFLLCVIMCTLAGVRMHALFFPLCSICGLLLSRLLPPAPYFPEQSAVTIPLHPAHHELSMAANAMSHASLMLESPVSNPTQELLAVLECAASQVCPSCARAEQCRKDQKLLSTLSELDSQILTTGSISDGDFPPAFHTQCLHPNAFRTAVNDAIESARAGQRLRRRMDETRSTAKAQFDLLGQYLRTLAEHFDSPEPIVNYSPDLAVRSAIRNGSILSGDRGAAFAGPRGTYYVLLCDGMGSGAEAAQESMQAISMLRHLLISGMDAEDALRFLNGIYILRDNGCFSTIDLLRINLTSANAILYKWGASASYLKRNRGLRLLGGSSLPPGVSDKEEMEQIHFSLDHGCVIVLLTDGLCDPVSRQRLESCDSLYPKDVAASLFVGREAPEDDCTAVALRLRPTSALL